MSVEGDEDGRLPKNEEGRINMKLVIPGQLPSQNEIIAAAKKSPYAYSKMKDENTQFVRYHAMSQKINPVSRANFVITYIPPNKRKDKDNISGGGDKFIFDGLQAAGILTNDGWSQIGDVTHRFDVDKHNPRIEIEIEEVKGDGNTT